jgi:hypothetical protein
MGLVELLYGIILYQLTVSVCLHYSFRYFVHSNCTLNHMLHKFGLLNNSKKGCILRNSLAL